MKKYKTWEVIKMLTENPTLIFKLENTGYGMAKIRKMIIRNGYFHCVSYNHDCDRIEYSLGQGNFNGNIDISSEWTLVQEPVSFMEAIKAYHEGKTIRCEYVEEEFIYEPTEEKKVSEQIGFIIRDCDFSSVCTGEILEGKWYIEED